MSGDEILYVGDHLFADVNTTKSVLRWRTALVLREMEDELDAIDACENDQEEIEAMMYDKVDLEEQIAQTRLELSRRRAEGEDIYEGDLFERFEDMDDEELKSHIDDLRDQIADLDQKLAPLVREDGRDFNATWGYLMRTGNDKSHLTRQVERYADIYTSRVSNLLRYTPYMFYRAPRGSVPHDPQTA